jgi:hypothetical protein
MIKEAANRGMTLRDYFAAVALPAVIEITNSVSDEQGTKIDELHIAKWVYKWADAMMAARGKEGERKSHE